MSRLTDRQIRTARPLAGKALFPGQGSLAPTLHKQTPADDSGERGHIVAAAGPGIAADLVDMITARSHCDGAQFLK